MGNVILSTVSFDVNCDILRRLTWYGSVWMHRTYRQLCDGWRSSTWCLPF